MYYKLIKDGTLEIEFSNDWLGVERVSIAGVLISKKSSVWGVDHPFEAVESGETHYYVLTTKINADMQVLIDLSKDGKLIQTDIIIPMATKPSTPKNEFKHRGKNLVRDYDLEDGILELQKAQKYSPNDPEIYFFLACAYSVLEKPEEGFRNLQLAVKNNMQNQEIILSHELLSFLRIHEAFAAFKESDYTTFKIS